MNKKHRYKRDDTELRNQVQQIHVAINDRKRVTSDHYQLDLLKRYWKYHHLTERVAQVLSTLKTDVGYFDDAVRDLISDYGTVEISENQTRKRLAELEEAETDMEQAVLSVLEDLQQLITKAVFERATDTEIDQEAYQSDWF